MEFKKHIPNLLTLGNLVCGTLATMFVFSWNSIGSVTAVIVLFNLCLVFDFLDGFSARLLKVTSPIGKQLDSLSDMISFGLLPGAMAFYILSKTYWVALAENLEPVQLGFWYYVPYCFVIIPAFSALRLAKFNIDERQVSGFIGLPTPANAIFFFSAYLIFLPTEVFQDPGFETIPGLISGDNIKWVEGICAPDIFPFLILIFSLLLVAPFRLMALKFKSFSFKENIFKFLLIASALVLLILFSYRGVPFIILLYFCFSILENLTKKTDEVHR